MTADPALQAFEAERDRLALLTRKGIGMPAAGLLYRLGVAALLQMLPQKTVGMLWREVVAQARKGRIGR